MTTRFPNNQIGNTSIFKLVIVSEIWLMYIIMSVIIAAYSDQLYLYLFIYFYKRLISAYINLPLLEL